MPISQYHLITVFQHQRLRLNEATVFGFVLTADTLAILQQYSLYSQSRYFSPIYNGLQFKNYVGIVQVGALQIEILPKLDAPNNSSENIKENIKESQHWRARLLDMLHIARPFDFDTPSSAFLQPQSHNLIDLYFSLYINQIRQLLQKGLNKKYLPDEGQVQSLKGQLLFHKQIQQNLVNSARFYTRHSQYSHEHLAHQLLYAALMVVQKTNANQRLQAEIEAICRQFPPQNPLELKTIKADTFANLALNKQSQHYNAPLQLAELILRAYQPDFYSGQYPAIALMFNMDLLWEKFVFRALQAQTKQPINYTIAAQARQPFFWQGQQVNSHLRADIKITYRADTYILDTKWKSPQQPDIEDLRQAHSYLHAYNARKVALIYAGIYESHAQNSKSKETITGHFEGGALETCACFFICPRAPLADWLADIANSINDWIGI